MNTVFSGMDEDAHMNHLKFTRMSDTDYEYSIQGLNKEQHDVFSTVQQYFRDLHKFHLGECPKPESLHLYVSGQQGCHGQGKSSGK